MKIVIYYDRPFRTWVAFFVDAEGNQVGECEYSYNKKDCLKHLKEREEDIKCLITTSYASI